MKHTVLGFLRLGAQSMALSCIWDERKPCALHLLRGGGQRSSEALNRLLRRVKRMEPPRSFLRCAGGRLLRGIGLQRTVP